MHKYEREIAELIEKLESQEEHTTKTYPRGRPPQLPRRRSSVGGVLRRVSGFFRFGALHFMVAGLILVIAGMLIRQHTISQWLTVIGIVLFLWPVAASLISRGTHRDDKKMWRGRVVEPEDASWSDFRNRMEHAANDFKRRFRRRY